MHLLQGSLHTATTAAMPDHLLRALPANSTVSCLRAYTFLPMLSLSQVMTAVTQRKVLLIIHNMHDNFAVL